MLGIQVNFHRVEHLVTFVYSFIPGAEETTFTCISAVVAFWQGA